MPKEKQDRDAIVSRAKGIASDKDRAAYIAEACGDNDDLKHQVEERVADPSESDKREKSDRSADTGPPALEHKPEQKSEHKPEQKSEHKPEQAEASNAEDREQLKALARKHRRMVAVGASLLLLLLIAALAGGGLAAWEWHQAGKARQAAQEADKKRKKAEKGEEEYKGKLHQSEAARKNAEKERDRAKEAAKEARHADAEDKAILDFVKKSLLSAGRSSDISLTQSFWAGTEGGDVAVRKKVTLREAVDRTEAKVAAAFRDRPLAEASVREMLGLAYLNLGATTQAVQQYEHAFALHQAEQGVNDPATAACRNQLAIAYRIAGRPDAAARLFQRDPDSPAHASALAIHGAMLLDQKKPEEAELKLRECLKIRQKIQPDDWTTFEAQSLLGEALREQKKYADAEPLLRKGYEGMKQRQDKIPSEDQPRVLKSLERLVQLYEGWGKPDEAAKWQKELEEAKTTKKP